MSAHIQADKCWWHYD